MSGRRVRVRRLVAESVRIAPTKANLLATVEDVGEQVRTLTDELHTYVTQAREAGASWAEIAERLGVTRQAAQQRFGR